MRQIRQRGADPAGQRSDPESIGSTDDDGDHDGRNRRRRAPVGAVSYTHLDVYKRQAPGGGAGGAGGDGGSTAPGGFVAAGGRHGVHSAQGLQPAGGSPVGGVVPQAARSRVAASAAAWIFLMCFYRVRKFAAKYKAIMPNTSQLEHLSLIHI